MRFQTPLIFSIVLMMLSAPVFAASGIDSEIGSDLPLNAQNTRVATLRAIGNAPNKIGVLEVTGLLDAKNQIIASSLINANAGAKIGPVNAACGGTLKGVLRYNDSNSQIEFCNGQVWKAASGGGRDCAATQWGARGWLPAARDGQMLFIQTCAWYQRCGSGTNDITAFQCIDGSWSESGTVFAPTQCYNPSW